MLDQSASPVRLPWAPLSVRESEVLQMASLGLTNREIAGRLHLSPHAIKFHLSSIYRKLGVANRTEAAVAYLTGRSGSGD
jgi:DNA-binding NarL/FixJ family response regulator